MISIGRIFNIFSVFSLFAKQFAFFPYSSVSLSLHSFSLSISIPNENYLLTSNRHGPNAFPSSSIEVKPFWRHLNSKTKTRCRRDFIHKKEEKEKASENEQCNLFQHHFWAFFGMIWRKEANGMRAQLLRRIFQRFSIVN